MSGHRAACWSVGLGLLLLGGAARAQAIEPARSAWSRVPLTFEANRGQFDPEIRYFGQGRSFELFLTQDGAVIRLSSPGHERQVARLTLAGARREVALVPKDKLVTESHYLRGQDPARWVRHVPHYARVEYHGVYPGVDIVFHGRPGRQLEYDFELQPFAAPSAIRLRFSGGAKPWIDSDGALVLRFADGGELRQPAPVLYQTVRGQRRKVDGGYAMLSKGEVGFRVGRYDARHPLTIDPFLSYSTYLGGGDYDDVRGVAVDGQGNTYLTGSTRSSDFPGSSAKQGSGPDVLLAKLSPDGSKLLFITLLSGAADRSDTGRALALDRAGNIFVAGDTASLDFPTTPGAVQPNAPVVTGIHNDGFLAKLDPSGSQLLYATYLGGGDFDSVTALALGVDGHAYVAGRTHSADLRTTPGAFQPALAVDAGRARHESSNAFVARIDPSKSGAASLVYETYLGNTDSGAQGLAVDASGDAYVAGDTAGAGFPSPHGLQSCTAAGTQGFLARLKSDGTALVYGTCLRGLTGETHARAVVVTGHRAAIVVGDTTSPSLPVSSDAAQPALAGRADAFVAAFRFDDARPQLSRTYASFLGGGGEDSAKALALGPADTVWIAGDTTSPDFPRVNSRRAFAGGTDVFLTELKPDGSPYLFSTLFGGESEDHAVALSVTPLAQAYVGGYTRSAAFPVTAKALQRRLHPKAARTGVPYDGFVFKYASFVNLGVMPKVATSPAGRIKLAYKVLNESTEPAEGVAFTARLPGGLRVRGVHARGECAVLPGRVSSEVRCELGVLQARTRVEVRMELSVEPAVPQGMALPVQARVEAAASELTPRDNAAVVEVVAGRPVAVSVR